MSLATTAPLRRAIERLIPERPFTIEFWDGTVLAATRDGGLERHREEAVRLVGEERVRVWRLYLRGARRSFETGFDSIYQVLCRRSAGKRTTPD